MKEFSATVSICKTWSNVQVQADTEAQAEEMLGQLNEYDLNKADPSPDEETTIDEIECIVDCDDEEEDED